MAPREGSTSSGPTMNAQDMMNEVIRLRQQVQQLHQTQQETGGQGGREKDLGEVIKPKSPGPYDGAPGALQGFLTQLKAYHQLFPTKMAEHRAKVLHAGGCMTGVALAWFEPIMRDYLNNSEDDQEDETKAIFANYAQFEKEIKKAFGTVDEARAAVYHMDGLRQKGSASDYAARFRQLASRLDWDDEPLMSAFFKGLKEEVKDELYKEDMPDNLSDYIAMAVRIDDRQYQRRLQRKQGKGTWNPTKGKSYHANQKRKREEPIAYGHTLNPGRMELDATKNDKKDKKGNCYNCGKPGHFANKCRAPKKEWKPAPEGKKQLSATNKQEIDHKSLSWTACYDDNCLTHLSDKNGSGWFPKEPKRRNSIKKQTIQASDEGIREQLHNLVQQDLDRQEARKTLAMTERRPRRGVISALFEGTSKEMSADWIRQQGERRQAKQERLKQREKQKREAEEAAQALVKLTQEKHKSIDDTSSSDNESWDQVTPEASDDEAGIPILRRENVTLGETPPPEHDDIGTQIEPIALTPGQKQAIKRYIPAPRGDDTAIAILAEDFTGALNEVWEPLGEYADDPRVRPTHEKHTDISWASCAHLTCETHFRTKARLNAFPIRLQGHAIILPYLANELREWRVTIRQNDQVMIIEPDPSTPLDCRNKSGIGEICGTDTCQIHMFQKAYEWHKNIKRQCETTQVRDLISTPSCETEDHITCYIPNCPEHLLDKAREWHKWHNGTPAAYKTAKRSLELYELEDPVGSRQSQFDNEEKLDRWYHLQGKNRKCQWKYAVNCEDQHCNQHEEMKKQIYERLCKMFDDGFCFKHPLDGTGPTEWYREMKRQINEESIPEQSKNEARHL